jgi:hypothetical protein
MKPESGNLQHNPMRYALTIQALYCFAKLYFRIVSLRVFCFSPSDK